MRRPEPKNHTGPKEKENASEELRALLEAIILLKGKYKLNDIINFLLGVKTKEILEFKLDAYDEFGAIPHRDDKFIKTMLTPPIPAQLP